MDIPKWDYPAMGLCVRLRREPRAIPNTKTLRSPRHRRLTEGLARERKRAGLTQAQLADAIGRPQSFIAKVEQGERRLDVVEFVAVAEALGRRPGELLAEMFGA
jgi:ribosome-binding protein aMBF1 (putative translation factor)